MALPFTVERTHPTVVTVRMSISSLPYEQWFLLRSDAHHDSFCCDQVLEKKHLDEAVSKGAGILDFGDLYDCMGGRYDKRADPKSIRPELREGDYFDALVRYAATAYEPYAANWILLARGNHESSVRKHAETDLGERLAERLRQKGSQVLVGTYQGWVRFMWTFHKTKRQSYRLRYTHGYGGGGQVTRDMIQAANRQLVYTDADIMVSGHSHDVWSVPVRRESLTECGRPMYRDIEVLKTGSYKWEYEQGDGFSAERGHAPKTLGAQWLRFYAEDNRILFETRRAK